MALLALLVLCNRGLLFFAHVWEDGDVFDCRRNALRVLIRGSSAPAIVRHTGGASALKASVVAGRRWTPVWVALRPEPGAVMCVAHFEPDSMGDIGAMANVDAIGLASDARPGSHRRTSVQRASR